MATKKQNGSEPAGYQAAMSELEEILRELDSSSVDVDVLSDRVSRASFLIEWCQSRIAETQMTVDEMVAGFDPDEEDDTDEDDTDEDEE